MRVPFQKAAFAALSTAAVVLSVSGGVFAQINLTSAGNIYTQNFDTLLNTGTANPYTDNSTILGLYARQFGGSAAGANAAPTTYRADNGASGTGALYSYGTTGSTDRALGSVGSGTFGGAQYGFRFVNTDASQTLTGFTISYNGEQWRDANTSPQTLRFSYAVFSSGMGDIGNETSNTPGGYTIDSRYTAFTGLDFTSPSNTSTAGIAIDGNTTGRTAVSNSVTGLTVARNQEVWVRLVDLNDTGNDHGLSMDDFTFTANFGTAATPEPGTFALFALGAGPATGLIALRRRKARRNKA